MSDFQVPVVRLVIKPHPNADKLEIAEVGGYQCIVGKGDFKTDDFAVYIPEAAIVPDDLIEKLGLTGRLAGPKHNRVKAIKLRGILSQGLVCPVDHLPISVIDDYQVDKDTKTLRVSFDGTDMAKALGITKYEPLVPAQMAGNVWNAGMARTIRYDIENIKKFPRTFEDGEEVVFTEKIHGTWCMAAHMPMRLRDPEQGKIFVSSKGQAAKGLCLKAPVKAEPQTKKQQVAEQWYKTRASATLLWHMFKYNWLGIRPENLDAEMNKKMGFLARRQRQCHNPGTNLNNIYIRAVDENYVLKNVSGVFPQEFLSEPIFVLGEVFGAGVQDLHYGASSKYPGFRVFDIYVGIPGRGYYLNDAQLDKACHGLRVSRVPVVYRGPFSAKVLAEYTSGTEAVTGQGKHLREGVVVRPVEERRDSVLGRVQLKSVSEKYLLRKGNTTEFQ